MYGVSPLLFKGFVLHFNPKSFLGMPEQKILSKLSEKFSFDGREEGFQQILLIFLTLCSATVNFFL